MKRVLKQSISLLLIAVMTVTVFAGCNSEEKSVIEAKASAVNYNTDGKYTTEITEANANLSGISADDVQVTYSVIDREGYNAALEKASEEEGTEESVDYSKYVSDGQAEITELTVADDNTITLSFVDNQAAENLTYGYGVYIKSKNVGASVDVEFPEFTLTPEVEYVLASDKDIRLTLVLDKGKFSEDISKENITLAGSFADMEIDSLSAAGKNLTIQLSGKNVIHESSGVYLDGVVEVDPAGIVNAGNVTVAKIPVKTEAAYFVTDELSVNGSVVTVPLVLIDVEDIKSLTKDSFKFDTGVKVTDCTVDSDTQVTLTLTIDGVSDKNSAAAALNGQTVKIGKDFEFIANFVSAAFYPVFDYVEENGDNLTFTLELYANNGTFGDELSADMFSLGHDFEGGSVVSVEKTSDVTAELIIDVPANGQTVEDLEMNGEVVISAGALINRWGDATDSDAEYLRSFTQDNMGKSASSISSGTIATMTDMTKIVDVVSKYGEESFFSFKDIATGLSSVAKGGTLLASGADIVKTALEMTGVIKSPHAEEMELLNKISENIQKIQDVLNEQTKMLQDLQKTAYNQSLSGFDTNVGTLNNYCGYIEGYFNDAKKLLKLETPEILSDDATDEEKAANDKEWEDYNKQLVKQITAISKDPQHEYYDYFKSFDEKYHELERLYSNVTASMSFADNKNPLYIFDQLCTLTYNYDIIAYSSRAAYRSNIEYTLKRALSYILIYYGCNPDNSQCQKNSQYYSDAMKQMDARAVTEPGHVLYCYTIDKQTVNSTCYFTTGNSTYAYPTYNLNLSESQKSDFVTRMYGRTLREELTLAKFSYIGKYLGLSLSFERHNDGSWSFWDVRHYTNCYADVIKWDDTGISKKVKTWYENGNKHYQELRLWKKDP